MRCPPNRERSPEELLDEAHKGVSNGKATKSTTKLRLVNGEGARPPIPIVWGISATVDRFRTAMAEAEGRSTLPDVDVDTQAVQESGLLKDTVVLDIPDEAGRTYHDDALGSLRNIAAPAPKDGCREKKNYTPASVNAGATFRRSRSQPSKASASQAGYCCAGPVISSWQATTRNSKKSLSQWASPALSGLLILGRWALAKQKKCSLQVSQSKRTTHLHSAW